jgi:Glycosyltransferase family 87
MARSDISKHLLSPFLVLCLAVISAASMVYYHQRWFIPRSNATLAARGLGNGYKFGNDFYPVWLSSKALVGRKQNPYAPGMTKEIQIGLYGRPLDTYRAGDPADQRMFVHPVFTDLLLWPASQFPFRVVRIVVFCALLALTIASVPLWLQAMGWNLPWKWVTVILLLTISSYSALEGLYAGQLGLLVAFLLAATLAAMMREKFLLAGILLVLTMMKPQVTVLASLYLLLWACQDLRRRKNLIVGLLGTGLVLLGTSFVVLPNWISSWFQSVLAYRRYTTPPLVREIVSSFIPEGIAAPTTILLTVIAVGMSLLLIWQNRKANLQSSQFWLTLSILLSVTTVILLPGQAVYDHLILIPALLVIWRERKQLLHSGTVPRLLLAVAAMVFLWPWMAALALVLVRPFVAQAIFDSPALLSLPIRTAASLPFAVLLLLVWNWRVNRPELKAVS